MKYTCQPTIIFLTLLFLQACSVLPFSSAARQFDSGITFFNRGEYQKAIPYFKKATELEPEYGEAYLYLGRSYINQGQWRSAIPALRSAYRLAPNETKNQTLEILIDGLINIAVFEVKQGNFTQAIGYLQESLELAPNNNKVKTTLGKTLFSYGTQLVSQGKLTEAISQFQEATKLTPNEFSPYFGLAKAFFQKGQIVEALSALKTAMLINPKSGEAQNLLMKLLMSQ